MSFLVNLHELKIEWKALGDIGSFTRGKRFVKTDMTSEGVPCIHYGEMYTHYGVWAEDSKSFLDEALAKKLRFANCGDVIIVAAGETIEDIGNGTAWLGKNDVVIHDACFSYKSDLNPKYVSYFLRTKIFKDQIKKSISSGKISAINANGLSKVLIPIPCPENPEKSLKIQSEIVHILDKFRTGTAELKAELIAELSMRKKQYDYYREQLVIKSSTTSEKLGDISEIYLGLTYTPTYVEKGIKFISAQNTSSDFLNLINVKYISEDEYRKSTSNAKPKRGDVLFTRVGSNLGHPVIVETDEPLCIFVSLGFIRVNSNKVLNSYIKHWMNTDLFWKQVRKKSYGAAKINLNTGWLKEFDVLLPTIQEQAHIVAILEKFEAFNNSICENLSREIELCQQQYEYYRDLLFSFPKSETVAV